MRYRLSSVIACVSRQVNNNCIACVSSQVINCVGHKQHIKVISSNMRWFRSWDAPDAAIAQSKAAGIWTNLEDVVASRVSNVIIVKRRSLLMAHQLASVSLRKHACAANDLLPFNMRIASDCTHSVTLALQQLQKIESISSQAAWVCWFKPCECGCCCHLLCASQCWYSSKPEHYWLPTQHQQVWHCSTVLWDSHMGLLAQKWHHTCLAWWSCWSYWGTCRECPSKAAKDTSRVTGPLCQPCPEA